MKKEFLVERQGKQFVLYAGLLDLAHERGLESIETELLQVPNEGNNHVAICRATVTLKGEFGVILFTGIGDAAPNNVAPMLQNCLIRMAECVPLRAKILTKRGWRECDELYIGESVLAYDLESDVCRWTPLQDVNVFPETRTCVAIGRSFYTECTPNHTWATANQNCKRRLVRFSDLTSNAKITIAAYTTEGGALSASPRDAAILGWLVTDGCIRDYTVAGKSYTRYSIYQSKSPQVEILKSLLCNDASVFESGEYDRTFPGGKTYRCKKSYRFDLKAEFARGVMQRTQFSGYKNLADVVLNLSAEARKSMLEAMLLADGCKKPGRDSWTFAKKSHEGVMQAFEILATLEGYALGKPQTIKSCDMPARTIRANRHISAAHLEYGNSIVQEVWCPTTEYGTWVMNLDGYITITGNTRCKARALRDAVNVGVTAFEELGGEEEPAPTPQASPIPPAKKEDAPMSEEDRLNLWWERVITKAGRLGFMGDKTPQYQKLVRMLLIDTPQVLDAACYEAAVRFPDDMWLPRIEEANAAIKANRAKRQMEAIAQ